MPSLLLSGLTVSYGPRLAVDGVSLSVPGGSLVGLVGPNGAGKTSLIRASSGVVPASAGSVRLGDEDMLRVRPRERARLLAVVPQAASLPAAFTAAEVVLMGRTPHVGPWGAEGARDRELAWEAMCRTGVEALASRRVGDLSGGERQRVVISRALAQEPQALLLDEAAAHLDLKQQVVILQMVRDIARTTGLAVLSTFHDLGLAALFSDRVALLKEGRLRAAGTPAEVFTREILSDAYGLPLDVLPHPVYGTPFVVPGLASLDGAASEGSASCS